MFIAWRGWGFLALIAVAPSIVSCIGLIDHYIDAAALSAGFLMAAGGVGCVLLGWRWHRDENIHTMYWIPLQVWGWIYIAVGNFFMLSFLGAFVKRAVTGRP